VFGVEQHCVVLLPSAPAQRPTTLQHWQLGQSASEVHCGWPGIVVVVVVLPSGPVVVVDELLLLGAVVGVVEIAEPQHCTRPVVRH
jgi:hypothetical protein